MPAPLSSRLDWQLANPIWASTLNPVIANPISSASILLKVVLAIGDNTINHGLGRLMTGWIITDIQGAATIYRSQPFNSLTLTLNSSAIVTISIGVF